MSIIYQDILIGTLIIIGIGYFISDAFVMSTLVFSTTSIFSSIRFATTESEKTAYMPDKK